MADYDSPWKEALALFFQEFQAFFFPEGSSAIDWTRGFETLDKELQQVTHDAETGKRIVDHLVKVWLTDGAEEWLLVHVEVQSQYNADFASRLYTYNSRLFDRYRRDVVSQVVLADDNPAWRPSHYEFARWGFRIRMDFPAVKLLDIVRGRADLESNPNPFAALSLAHVRTLETSHDPAERRAWKFRLVKSLYERGLSADAVRKLFRVIDWMMALPQPMERMFWNDMDQYERENKMPFVDIATRVGIEKGTVQTLVESILLDWEFKFSQVDPTCQDELRSITSVDLLRKIQRAGKTIGSLDELRKLWKPD